MVEQNEQLQRQQLAALDNSIQEQQPREKADALKGLDANLTDQINRTQEGIDAADEDILDAQERQKQSQREADELGDEIEQLDREIEEDEEIRAKAEEDADATCVQLMESFPEGTNIPQFVQDLCK